MRFTTVFFEENLPQMKGLKKIDLTAKPLGAVVALVGKNGSGKSRILEVIEGFAKNLRGEDILFNKIDLIETNISEQKTYLNNIKNIITKNSSLKNDNIIINELKPYVEVFKSIISPKIKKIDTSVISKIDKNINVIYEDLLKNAPLTFNNFDFLSAITNLSYFQKISDELNLERYNLIAENDSIEKIQDTDSFKKFEKFKYYFEKFVGKKIVSKAKKINTGEVFSSDILVGGKKIDTKLFSPGESVLYCYAILFYLLDVNSNNGIDNCVIILDEPENHLHPSAQIQVISAIKDIIKDKGQLWLATHSLPLISSLEAEEIFIVKNDCIVSPNRYNPGNSIVELMESEENSYRIKEFLLSSSDWAYSNFMSQCFLEPEVHFVAGENDPQITMFRELIASENSLAILDYGAGKGRLAKAFAENEKLKEKINFYCALEPEPVYLKELEDISFIKEIYSDSNLIPEEFFDFVLLFNVLHEITPEKWSSVFNAIKKSLNKTGFLIIVEDKFLPKGEKIGKYGYLILNEHQILDLFKIEHQMLNSVNPLRNNADNRITFSIITKEQINVTRDSIILSINNLSQEIFGKMEETRKLIANEENSKKDLSLGRKYAHYSQLYINTKLAEKYLPQELNKTSSS